MEDSTDARECAIRDARNELALGDDEALCRVEWFLKSPYAEVRTIACQRIEDALYCRRPPVDRVDELYSLLVPALKRMFTERLDDDAYNQYECVNSLMVLFHHAWRANGTHNVAKVKSAFTKLCRTGSAADVNVVLLGALEHLFVDESIRRFFRDWTSDAKLDSIYREACKLADGFRRLR